MSKIKIVLIKPPALSKAEIHDCPDHPDIGLGYLAGYLLARKIDVRIIDAKLDQLDQQETLKRLFSKDFDLVGLTAFTHEIINAASLAKKIKERADKVIVIGGVHVTALPVETLKEFQSFDIGVIGEGEEIFYNLIRALESKKSLKGIKGTVFRDSRGKIILNQYAEKPAVLDNLAFPAWQLSKRCDHYHIISARGCPYRCVFCMSPYGRNIVRERSPENVIRELDWVINTYHPERITFNDETFGINKDRAFKLLDMMVQRGYCKKVKFSASLRVNLVTEELLRKMKKAGFNEVEYGVETGNAEILKIIKKGITLDQAKKAVAMTKKVGIKTCVGFIMGHPHETKKTIQDTIKFIVKLNPHLVAIGIMSPYPNTEVAQMAARGEGGYRILSTKWSDFNKQIGNALELKNISRKELEYYQLMGYLKLYIYNFRIFDFIGFVWHYRHAGIAFLKNFLKRK